MAAQREALLSRERAVGLFTSGAGMVTTRTPVGRNGKSFDANSGVGLFSEILNRQVELAGAERISKPYHESIWAYVCAKTFAAARVMPRLQVWDSNPDENEGAKVVTTHPIVDLLTRKPNAHQSARKFHKAGVIHSKMDGEDVWFLMDPDGLPVGGMQSRTPTAGIPVPDAILSWRGSDVEIKPNARGFPGAFKYPARTADGKDIWFPAHSVIQFAEYDPYSPMRGFGDAEALTRTLAAEFQAERYIEAGLRNGGDWGGWMLYKGKMSTENLRAAQDELDDEVASVDKRDKWKIVQDAENVEVKPNDTDPRDMEYSDLRRWNRQAVFSGMGVPGPIVGVLDDVKFANFEWAVETFWRGGNGVLSYLLEWEDTVNAFFFPRIREANVRRWHAKHDLSNIDALKEDMTDTLKAMADIAARSPLTVADVATLQGVDLEGEMLTRAEINLADSLLTTVERIVDPPDPPPVAPPFGGGEPDEAPPDEAEDADDEQGGSGRSLVERKSGDVEPAAPEPPDSPEFAERRAYAKRFDESVLARGDAELKREVRSYLRKYEQATLARVRAFAKNGGSALKGLTVSAKAHDDEITLDDLLLDHGEWSGKLDDTVRSIIEGIYMDAAADIAAEIGGSLLLPEDPAVLEFLEDQVIQLSEGATSTLSSQVRKALEDVLGSGPSTIGELQAAVREKLPELEENLRRVFGNRDARALTIARTETAHAANGARFEAMSREGITSTTWITSGDGPVSAGGTVRDPHWDLDGTSMPLGEEFLPGLKYPSDPDAEASLVINCRCIARPDL